MRRRLWVQIQLALVGVIAVCFAAAWLSSSLLYQPQRPLQEAASALGTFVVQDLPPPGPRLDRALKARSRRLTIGLALWDSDGELLATSHARLPGPQPDSPPLGWVKRSNGKGVILQLEDGRWLTAGVRAPQQDHRATFLLTLSSAMLAIAAASILVSRRLTRRLEDLQQGVVDLGEGDLSARVCSQGQDEVAQLARSFNTAAARIEDLVQGQQRLLASASHELRSPLGRLRVALELMGEEDQPEGRQRLQLEADRDIRELNDLIEDLLLASRLEIQAPDLQQPQPLQRLLLEELQRLEIDWTLPEGGFPTPGDARLLRRALRNLLENAQRHGAAPIEVRLTQEGGWNQIRIEDSGPGIPEPERERIFEAFYRPGGLQRDAEGGAGLGLSLVRRIAQRHGGSVRCEPSSLGGAAFVLLLPREPATG